MMDKIRVKDLAADLKMQPKDLLTLIKDLHIQAKASTSVLADEEITRIKDRIQQANAAERRESTDVIVRRRRKVETEETPDLNAEQTGPEKAPEKAQAKASESDPAAAPEPEKAAAKEAEKAAETPTAAKAGRPAETAGARVISRPASTVRKDDSEAKTQVKAAPGKTTPGKGDDRRPSQANVSAEPEKGADGSTVSSTPQFAESPQTERQEQTPAQPSTGVRIISRPSADQKTTRPAGGDRRPTGTRPGAQPGRAPGYQRPADGAKSAGRSDGRPDARADRAPGRFAGQDTRGPGQAPPDSAENEGRAKKRAKGKRTVDFSDEKRFRGEGDEGWARAGSGRKNKTRKAQKPEVKQVSQPLKAAKRKIRMEEFIRVADLAHQIGLKAGEIIKILFNLGIMATINQSLDVDTATLVAAEFSYEVERVGFSEDEFVSDQSDDPSKMLARPPVVTIMGHVDHGKTSLLDAIRKTSVTSGEAGGITQHIGAYHVNTKKGDIVFLDTPGHEAFTAMRARGAEVTDIVVLVVAADDGVMEQTREAINHAKAANVPIMVAVNKMDKAEANPDRVKRELAELGMVPEEWGGDVTFSYVSAKTRAGLDDFLELLALQAEILELKANPDKAARGHIVEAKLDKGRGALGTVLIQQGTLRVGDSFVSGIHNGRVRAMFDDQGKKVSEAGPSMPVEVQGFEGVPEAGEEFIVIADEKTARRIAEARALKQRERELAKESRITLETFLSSRADAEEAQVLNLVVKADVHGSLEAIKEQLKKLSGDKVRINMVHGGTGAVSESDVLLAAASAAIIIGFNVRPNQKTKDLAEQEKVDIRFYDIIYKLTEEITGAMEGMLSPVEKEVSIGAADVRETFSVPKVGIIAGCMVSDGKITRNSKVRLLRDGVVIHTGSISSLRRFKDDAREVVKGYECGIGIENYNDLKVGDVIEAFEIVEEAAKL